MTITEAQRDLRRAFVGGGPGVFISALVWLATAIVEQRSGIAPAFTVLFFGGMLDLPGCAAGEPKGVPAPSGRARQ